MVSLKKVERIADEVRDEAEEELGPEFDENECLGGYCWKFSKKLAKRLRMAGIPARQVVGIWHDQSNEEDTRELFESRIVTRGQRLRDLWEEGWDHAWVELENGTIVDITGDQYFDDRGYAYPPVQILPPRGAKVERARYWPWRKGAISVKKYRRQA